MDIEQALAFTDTLVFAKSGSHLSDLQQAMLRESWSWQRQSYDQIADTYGYSPTYLKHDVGPKLWRLLSTVLEEKVNKTNFRAAIERRWQSWAEEQETRRSEQQTGEGISFSPVPPSDYAPVEKQVTSRPPSSSLLPHQDWGEAVDVSFFYGRQSELAQLEQWVIEERCQIVGLLGMGGMGKTSLSVKLAQRLQSQFDWVIWRSLRNAPPLQEMLTELLRVLSHQQEGAGSATSEGITHLLHHLRSHRCLLVLDNVEAILQGSAPNAYLQGYEGYGELFRQIGETPHLSCLVLTSREKPQDMALLEGAMFPVRSLQLNGLKQPEGRELFSLKGVFQGSEADWNRLIEGCSGNPLALKLISTTIQNLFAGNITDFLAQNTFVFGNIRQLIQQQFERLSDAEKTVMYWLAIYREPAAFADLRADIFPPIAPQKLIEVMESLEQRSLIERKTLLEKPEILFSLQPVVMEYASDRLIEQVCQEIQANLKAAPQQKLLFKRHALLKAQAKDYIRETQVRLILQPLIDRLLADLADDLTLEDRLAELTKELQGKPPQETGYAGGNILNLLSQRQPCLSGYDFSRLTIWQAYLQNVNLHQINFANSDLTHSVFAETLGIVFSVAFSPDGSLLATGDADGLRLWRVADGTPLLDFRGHQGWVWAVAFSADGQWLASGSNDKTIRLWEVSTGKCLKTLQGHNSSVWCVAFSADGQTLASGGDEPTVRLWNTHTGDCREVLAGHTDAVLAVAFSADGTTLVSGSADRTIRVWDTRLKDYCQIYQGHRDRVWSVALSADGQTLASGSADCTIKIWDVLTGNCLRTLEEHSDRVRSIAFAPHQNSVHPQSDNGPGAKSDAHSGAQTLISGSDDQTVRVWDVNTGQCLNLLRGHTNSIFSVSFNADGRTLASGSADQTVKLWHLNQGRCLKTLKGYTNSVFSVVFSADGQTLASGSTDQTIRLWQVDTGICCKTLLGHSGWVTSVAFHPAGDLLASSSADQTIRLWSVRTGQCLNLLQGHSNWVQSVSFSPDGEILASSGDDRTIRLWSVRTGECLKLLQGHTSWIWAIRFSPNGKLLASSSADQTIRLWSVDAGECVNRLQGHTRQIQSIAFSPDGQLLSSASGDETVRLWEVSTGQCLKTLQGHSNNVWSVAFSPDGKILASGSLDQTVRLWDVNTGNCLNTLPVLTHSVRSSIAFANHSAVQETSGEPSLKEIDSSIASGHTLATGSQNGTIQLWNTETGQCLKTLIPDRPYKGTNITQMTGITAAQKAALKALGAVET
jgi:WD40 repeat protein